MYTESAKNHKKLIKNTRNIPHNPHAKNIPV